MGTESHFENLVPPGFLWFGLELLFQCKTQHNHHGLHPSAVVVSPFRRLGHAFMRIEFPLQTGLGWLVRPTWKPRIISGFIYCTYPTNLYNSESETLLPFAGKSKMHFHKHQKDALGALCCRFTFFYLESFFNMLHLSSVIIMGEAAMALIIFWHSDTLAPLSGPA